MSALHNGWTISTEHPASSYGLAVLVAPDGSPRGMGDMLTTREAAQVLGLSLSRVQDYIADGRLAAEKHGPVNLVRVGDVLALGRRPTGRPRKR